MAIDLGRDSQTRRVEFSRNLGAIAIPWIIVLFGLAYLASGQADFYPQLYFSGGLLAFLLIFKAVDPSNRFARIGFLCIATFIVLRYVFWRVLYTIEFTDWVSFVCALILFFAELYGIIIFLAGNFVNLNPVTRKPVPLPPDEELPSVDVLVPSYNESPELLEVTLIAALQMRYPENKRRVYLCDDGGTDQKCSAADPKARAEARARRAELTALCESLGAVYLTRPQNRSAKAGNLNEAMKTTTGELVVIFDADHVPTVDFLEKTVGLFGEDAKLFLVQTPHFFTNADPIEKNLDTFYQMPSESEMFYRVIQPGLDFWNATFFCGSGAVMRRSLLDKAGGIAGETITEDAETALGLHARGYNSAYISTPLLSGLAPETMGGFIKQRTRWAQGMVQIFLLKCPLFLPGLTLPQRICYFNSCLFWLFPFSRIIYLLAPTAFLFFDLKIYAANWQTFCSYVVPYILSVLLVSNYLYGRVRWAFISELYEVMQSVYTLPAILMTILNPRSPNFNVTPKGEFLSRDFISPLATPFYILAAINFATMIRGIYKAFHTTDQSQIYPILITLFWGTFNTVMLLAALGALLERRQRRATSRMPANIEARISVAEKIFPVRVVDLSLGGCKLAIKPGATRWLEQHPEGDLLVETDEGREPLSFHLEFKSLVDTTSDNDVFVGAQFQHRDLAERKEKVRLVLGSSDRWVEFQRRRESKLGITASLVSLTYLGVKHSINHAIHLLGDIVGSITGHSRRVDAQTMHGPK